MREGKEMSGKAIFLVLFVVHIISALVIFLAGSGDFTGLSFAGAVTYAGLFSGVCLFVVSIKIGFKRIMAPSCAFLIFSLFFAIFSFCFVGELSILEILKSAFLSLQNATLPFFLSSLFVSAFLTFNPFNWRD